MSERQEQRQVRRVFTEEFKRDTVQLAEERGNVAQAARDLGVHESVLSRWKKRTSPGATDNQKLWQALTERLTADPLLCSLFG